MERERENQKKVLQFGRLYKNSEKEDKLDSLTFQRRRATNCNSKQTRSKTASKTIQTCSKDQAYLKTYQTAIKNTNKPSSLLSPHSLHNKQTSNLFKL